MFEELFEKKGLSLDRLKTLLDVGEAGSIRQAVGDDPVKQSLASRQIKELESYYGVKLACRDGRYLSLTAEGKTLAGIVRESFSGLSRFKNNLEGRSITLDVGVGDSLFQWYLLPCLPPLHAAFPSIVLTPHSIQTEEIVRSVRDGRFAFGLVRETADELSGMQVEPVGVVRYSVFAHESMMKASVIGEQPKLMLKKLPFASITGCGEYAVAVDELLRKLGGEVALRCSSLTQVGAAVQAGQYVAVLPEQARTTLPEPDFHEYRFDEMKAFDRQIVLVRHLRTGIREPTVEEYIVRLTASIQTRLRNG